MRASEDITRPVFIEKESDAEKDILELQEILKKIPVTEKETIERQITNKKKGLKGENNIIFELKNCQIPMVCIHNLYLICEDVRSQIDFVFVTRDKVYVVESKNLYGEIEINERGEFFRVYKGNSTRMYSPLTQCEHHLNTMKLLRKSIKKEEFPRLFTEKYYEDHYHPLIVISNPTCKLNIDKAPKEIVDKIIHTDQLASYIQKNDDITNYITQRAMENFSNFYSHYHQENPRNYMEQFRNLVPPPTCPTCGAPLTIREAKKGKYVGTKFYGCSTYPKCRFTDFSQETTARLNK